jgi:hypothetical protein
MGRERTRRMEQLMEGGERNGRCLLEWRVEGRLEVFPRGKERGLSW